MNTSANVAGPQAAVLSATRPLYWSVRRELWENRSIYLAPMAAAAVFLLGFLIQMIRLRAHMSGVWPSASAPLHDLLTAPYELAAALIMGTAVLVGIVYSLDALYGERRDRSILLWKSLPVSDLTTVLAKVAIPAVILPLFSYVLTLATHLLMLMVSSVVLLGSGLSMATIWQHSSVFSVSTTLLYHIVTVHGLWYAPIYGWLLLVSAWAPRAPFIWAFLPPFVIGGAEKIAFNTSHFFHLLMYRVTGPEAPGAAATTNMMDSISALGPVQFFSEPGLWIGLAVAAVCLAGAVQLRRYRGPM